MAKYTGIYTACWSVDVEADSYEEAMDILNSYSTEEIIGKDVLEYIEPYLDEVIEPYFYEVIEE